MRPIHKSAILGGVSGTAVMGVIVFPLLYVFVVLRIIPGPSLKSGLLWGMALWIAAIMIVMPIAGAGFMMANVGGMMAVMASLWAIWSMAGYLAQSPQTAPRRAPLNLKP